MATATVLDPSAAPRRTFVARSQADLNPVDPHLRAAANADALQTILDLNGRPASHREQATIARFSGWGAVPHLFDDDPDWDSIRARIRPLLDRIHPEAWDNARSATLNSHYTDADVAARVWGLLRNVGLTNHDDKTPIRVFEPGVGSGVFLSTCPRDLNVDWYGVDIDPTAVAVARALHPGATIDMLGFEQVTAPDATFDLVVGNVPYGRYKVADPRHNRQGWTIHNHALYKAVALTRPGGIICLLTSHFTADSKTAQVRAAIDMLADLVTIVRFPNRTFERAAGTNTVEDLIVLRRRPLGVLPPGEQALLDGTEQPGNWVETVDAWDRSRNVRYRVNTVIHDLTASPPPGVPYGVALGRHETGRGPNGRDDYMCTLTPTGDTGTLRDRAIGLFDSAVAEAGRRARHTGMVYTQPETSIAVTDTDGWDSRWADELDTRKEGSIHLNNKGGLVRISAGRAVRHTPKPVKDTAELEALVALRDATLACLAAMVNGASHTRPRRTLGRLYDEYTATWGALNRYTETTRIRTDPETGEAEHVITRARPSMGGFRSDPDCWTVMALENWDDSTRTATKAPIFDRNVVGQPAPAQPTDLGEAVAVSLDRTAGIDLDLIARLLHTTPAAVETGLNQSTVAYLNPLAGWEHASRYLAGDVRTKLDVVAAAGLTRNINALQQVIPPDLGPEEIDLRLGSPLIDTDDIAMFAEETMLGSNVYVTHVPALASWDVDVQGWVRRSVESVSVWGTRRADAYKLLGWALNLKPATVYDTVVGEDGKDRKVLNRDETDAAQLKLDQLGDRFASWIWQDPDRAAKYVERYNRVSNCWAAPRFDGSHLTLPGMSTGWTMRPHQKDAIWRFLAEGGGVLAHTVGTGKTAVLCSTAVEQRRLGIAAKPLIVIPNHMLEQIAREARQLYPAARMLVCSAEDASKDGRRAFIARCATGNWDLVVMTHSAFGLIPLSAESQARHLAREIGGLRRAMAAAGGQVKQIEQAIKRKETKIRKALTDGKDMGGLTFEAMGVDMLMIDEAHLFKNLDTASSVPGIAGRVSRRAEDLAVKIDWLTERYGDFSARGPLPQPGLRRRRVVLATGTPVANSIAELWVMARLADRDRMVAAGYEMFDGWFGAFGQTVARLEVSPDGGGFRVKHRPARFRNVPELLALWLQVADVRSLANIRGIEVPEVTGGRTTVTVEPSSGHRRYVAELMVRADRITSGSPQRRPTVRWFPSEHGPVKRLTTQDDNLLWVVGDGRKAALHLRLVGAEPDPAGGKIRACATEVARIYHATRDRAYGTATPGSLQLVFSDSGVNPADRCGECGYPAGQGGEECATCTAEDHTAGMSAYELFRLETARQGVPYEQIRFIGEAKTDAAKASMFNQARAGQIAVLVGSTEKMGMGVNVQSRAVALHHLDAPWRPCDIEQREGRIVRQGNLNPAVDLRVYVTEGTFDAYMWQTLETKAGFIDQVTAGQVNARTVDDIGESSMGFAEIKAAAAGNPLILEHAQIGLQIRAARGRKSTHRRQHAELVGMRRALELEHRRTLETLRSVDRAAQRYTRTENRGFQARPPHHSAGVPTGVTLDGKQAVAAWINWWREDRNSGGRNWRQRWIIGEVGPFTVDLTVDHVIAGGELETLPVIVINIDGPVRIPVGRRDLKLPHLIDWPILFESTVEDTVGQAGPLRKKAVDLDAQIARAASQADVEWEGETGLAEMVARLDHLDALMRGMTEAQAPDPARYPENPPDLTDWDLVAATVTAPGYTPQVTEPEPGPEPEPVPTWALRQQVKQLSLF